MPTDADTRQPQLGLQRLHRRLEQVHKARDGGEHHRREQDDSENVTEGHLLEDLGQRDEQKRRPGRHVQPEGEHRRHHDAGGHKPGDGIENGDVLGGVHHVHISLEVTTVDECAAPGKR